MVEKSRGRVAHDHALARQVISNLDKDIQWDAIKSRDIPHEIMDYVRKEITRGVAPGAIAKALGFHAGTNDRRWSKIQAGVRQGFRADAEAYLYQQTQRFFATVEKARVILEDAFENGVPVVVVSEKNGPEIIHVKGATKELAGFIKAYSESIQLPVNLWKTYGAIGEKKEANTGVTIVVQNSIPMPSEKEILDNQARTIARGSAIEAKSAPTE